MIDEKWNQLTDDDWREFAQGWLAELREEDDSQEDSNEDFNDDDFDDDDSSFGQAVVSMNFTAHPEKQWQFILVAVSLAESDDDLGHIAAGPIEHLLGWHGDKYISRVEEQAASDAKFARAMLGVWKYMMNEEVWARVQAIQKRVENQQLSNDGNA
ncbi:MAG: hypothetical protein M3209_15070 [Acidobacteriota bacterium]|nr:hypothetical protein [Acidobacteriota bacterium]